MHKPIATFRSGYRRVGLLLTLSFIFTTLPTQAHADLSTDLKLVNSLPVKGRAPKTGYNRAQFGSPWQDVDRNGCDTRNDILKRDLQAIVYRSGTNNCIILSGSIIDPYSGENINFTRGVVSSLELQIDHIVSLSNAWQTGASKLTLAQRTALANDPLNLLAVKGDLNSIKSDSDAASWLPPLKSYRCTYVGKQLVVKKKYHLWLTPSEKSSMLKVIKGC